MTSFEHTHCQLLHLLHFKSDPSYMCLVDSSLKPLELNSMSNDPLHCTARDLFLTRVVTQYLGRSQRLTPSFKQR